MQDKRIADEQITASSEWKLTFDPFNARLNQPRETGKGGGWCADITRDRDPWIQVHIGIPTLVSGIITQGRSGSGDWVITFEVFYGDDGLTWQYVMDSLEPMVMMQCYCTEKM